MFETFIFFSQTEVLVTWSVITVALVAWTAYRQGWSGDTLTLAGMLVGFGIVVWFMIPRLGIRDPAGEPALAIRGYGFFVALGVICGVGLAALQARRAGRDTETIFTIAFCMIVVGFVGARLFYVIQYWEEFDGNLSSIVRFYQGGLVVYGAFIGAACTFIVFVLVRKLPPLEIGDLLIPGMLLGQALGRVGCLMNGCCWGGVCEEPIAITFPVASPPYVRHLETGALLGFQLERTPKGTTVARVDPSSRAAQLGLKKGDRIAEYSIAKHDQFLKEQAKSAAEQVPLVTLLTVDGLELTWNLSELPERSLPVHPTQIYSAINAGLICLMLVIYFPFRRRDGELVAIAITLYPISRFLLEMIRSDESGFSGTSLTISQWVSICILVTAGFVWFYVLRQPPRSPAEPELSS